MSQVWVLVVVLLMSACGQGMVPSASGEEPTDLREYLAQIRASGVSESGRGEIDMIDNILTGGTVLEYAKDEASGRYYPSYRSTMCANPNLDSAAAEDLAARENARRQWLQKLADSDHSGFVSTAEASALREVLEFGFANSAIRRGEGSDREKVAEVLGLSPDVYARRLEQYASLRAKVCAGPYAESCLLPE